MRGLRGATYRVMQATDWYATVGDLDWWASRRAWTRWFAKR